MTPITFESNTPIGARVRIVNRSGSHYGHLVSASAEHATVKCDDGKRRKVKWTRPVKSLWSWGEDKTEHCVYYISPREEWVMQCPPRKMVSIQVGDVNFDVQALRAELSELTQWASECPDDGGSK